MKKSDGPGGATPARAAEITPKRPLYLQVSDTLRDEIVTGVYPVGSRLPTEDALCGRFCVSRYTVREALRLLREDGLVTSRKRAGTIVIPPQATGSDIQQVMSINDLLAFSSDSRLSIDSMRTVPVDATVAKRAGMAEGEQWLEVLGYRFSEGAEAPACRTEFYINRAFAAVGRILQRHSGPVFPLIEDLFGISIVKVEQQISATLLDAAMAQKLGAEEASAALEIRRTYTTTDATIAQITINTHPASRFQHSMSMRRVRG